MLSALSEDYGNSCTESTIIIKGNSGEWVKNWLVAVLRPWAIYLNSMLTKNTHKREISQTDYQFLG